MGKKKRREKSTIFVQEEGWRIIFVLLLCLERRGKERWAEREERRRCSEWPRVGRGLV